MVEITLQMRNGCSKNLFQAAPNKTYRNVELFLILRRIRAKLLACFDEVIPCCSCYGQYVSFVHFLVPAGACTQNRVTHASG